MYVNAKKYELNKLVTTMHLCSWQLSDGLLEVYPPQIRWVSCWYFVLYKFIYLLTNLPQSREPLLFTWTGRWL